MISHLGWPLGARYLTPCGPTQAECPGLGGWLAALVALGVLCLATPLSSQAQDTITVSSPSECPGCASVSGRVIASLGSVEDSVGPRTGSWVAFDGQSFVVAPTDAYGRLAAYSEDGVLTDVRGRAGEGPGEFPGIYQVGYADGLWHVVSPGRITYLDRGLELVGSRTLTVSPLGGMVALPDTVTVLNGWSRMAEGAGLPLHVVNGGTGSVRSFGQGRGLALMGGPEMRHFLHTVGPAADAEGFWAAPALEYAFERRALDGSLLLRLEVEADWFQPRPEVQDPFAEWPGTAVVAIRQDRWGRLWVATYMPRTDWQPASVPDSRVPVELPDLFDTRIEVFSLEPGRLMARGVVSGIVVGIVDDGLLVRQRRGAWDEVVLDIVQLTLDGGRLE